MKQVHTVRCGLLTDSKTIRWFLAKESRLVYKAYASDRRIPEKDGLYYTLQAKYWLLIVHSTVPRFVSAEIYLCVHLHLE